MRAVPEILVNNLIHLFTFGKVPLCMKIIQMVFMEYRLFAPVGLLLVHYTSSDLNCCVHLV